MFVGAKYTKLIVQKNPQRYYEHKGIPWKITYKSFDEKLQKDLDFGKCWEKEKSLLKVATCHF